MAQITVRLSDDLLAKIDRERELVPRERWVRRALEQALDGSGSGQPTGGNSAGGAVTAAPLAPGPAPARAPVRDAAALGRQAALNKAKGL